MNKTSFSSSAYTDLSRSYATKSRAAIFTNTDLSPDMNPNGITFRECRDSDTHPTSFPIIIALDETGSMGTIPENLIKNKLGKLMEILINNGVKGAEICFVGIGDHYSDNYPLQIGQFECGTEELDKWLTSIVLEGKGGGQDMESYQLAWLFAARHTSTDSFEKRGIKGFIFTIGDEFVHPTLESDFLRDYMGYTEPSDTQTEDLFEEARKTYNVFHIHCNHANYTSNITNKWKGLIGKEHLIEIEEGETDSIAEVISSTVAMINGADMKELTRNMDSRTANSVSKALSTIPKADITNYSTTGVIVL